jgi:putative SOS response-associated peptidase YedK
VKHEHASPRPHSRDPIVALYRSKLPLNRTGHSCHEGGHNDVEVTAGARDLPGTNSRVPWIVMCGRYAAILPAEHIVALFQTVGPIPNWAGTWNMAPTRDAPVIRLHPETRERRLDLLRWGLVPHWAKDPKATRQPINARGETIASTPMFRDAFARRRCLVPADAFYEWQATPDGKLPWAVARADAGCMVFAGLWEGWRGADGSIIRSFTIVTSSANEQLHPLHERMPVVLEEADWPLWLGETEGDPASLVHPSATAFRVWRVGTAVNNARLDTASLLDPV